MSITKSIVSAIIAIVVIAIMVYTFVGDTLKGTGISASEFFTSTDSVVEELMRVPEIEGF